LPIQEICRVEKPHEIAEWFRTECGIVVSADASTQVAESHRQAPGLGRHQHRVSEIAYECIDSRKLVGLLTGTPGSLARVLVLLDLCRGIDNPPHQADQRLTLGHQPLV
jgi:hypothetical protein